MLRIIQLLTVMLTSLSVLTPQAIAATQTVCATPNALIPDNNMIGVRHTLTLTDTSIINGLHIKGLTIHHQHIGELTISLKHGDRVIKIMDSPGIPADKYGCTGKNFSNLTISDAASDTLEDNCASTDPAYDNSLIYKPNEPLSVFDGISAAGDWTLTVADNYDYNQTDGQLTQWCLEYSQPSQGVFFSQPPPGTPLIFNQAEYPTGSLYTIPVSETSGKDSLLITNVLITSPGNATADFSITLPKVLPTPSAPLIIQPGQTYSFVAQCKPTDVGLRTATFEIHTNLPAPLNLLSYPLQCDGKAAWFASNTPPTLDFGKVAVSESSRQLIQLSEAKGTTQLKILKASLSGAQKGDFSFDSSKLPLTILQKGTAELPVTCQPTAGGLRTAKLVLTTNAPNALTFAYTLKCLGDAAVAIFKPVESSQIAIEKVRVNGQKSYKIGVRNAVTATTALKLYDYQLISSQNANLFKLITQPSEIEIGGSGNIEVACDAQEVTPGNYSAKLRFATNDPTKLVIEYSFTCSIEQSKPQITLTPAKGSKINFDRVQTGAKNKIKTIELENSLTASQELELSQPTFSGEGAAAFSIVSIPIKIGIGLKDVVQVQCNTAKTGSYTAILTLTTNDPEQPTLDYPVSCEVSDIVAPLYDSQPAPNNSAIIDLGNVVLGTTSSTTTIMVNEIGNDTLRVQLDTVALTGTNASDFKVVSPTFPFDIADDGAAVPVTVTCQATAMGLRTATLNLFATDIHGKAVENFPHPRYNLQCSGYLPIYNSVNYPLEGDIEFGITSVGQNSAQTLTLKNTGNGDLTVDQDTVLLLGDGAENFSIKGLPATLPAGNSKSFGIQCAPTSIGDLQAQLHLISNDPNVPHPQYTLKCTGREAVGASYHSKPAADSTLTLDTTLGSAISMPLIIQEVGTAVLDVGLGTPLFDGENADDFSLDMSNSSPFAEGKSHFYIPDGTPEQTLKITCKPSGQGQRVATLHLTSNDASKPEINYHLVCNSDAVSAGYQSSPIAPNATIDCGIMQVGSVITRSFDITETANADLIVNETVPGITGSHPNDFKVNQVFPLTIKDGSGEHKTVTVQCQPTEVGVRSAILQFTTNDLSQPTVSYPLQVTGSNVRGSQLTLQTQGTGQGKIVSQPEGVNCTAIETATPVIGQTQNSCVSPTAMQNVNKCTAYFDRGTQITLTTQPEQGSMFVGWNPECTKGIATLIDDTTCIAEFALIPSVDSSDLEISFLDNNDLDFGTVNVGEAVARTLMVKNKTTQPLSLSNMVVPSGLLLENSSEITLAAGQTLALTLHLETHQPASVLGQLTFQIQGKNYSFPARAKVIASDDAPLTISYPNATQLDFGTINVGETATREVLLKNNSSQSISLDNVVLPAEITYPTVGEITLAPQQTLSLILTFKPVTEGNYRAAWSLNTASKIYHLQAIAQVMTAQLADGCYAAGRLYVNALAIGKATGRNWNDAFPELQSALMYANQCDTVREIWVAEGTYQPTRLRDRSASFQLRKNLAVYGGFKGSESALSARELTTPSTLSGDIGQLDDMTDNSYHVVNGSETDATTILDGFNVVAGQADGDVENCGGGMFNNNGSPTVTNVSFAHNYAKQGAGMCNQNGSHPSVRDVIFTENQAVQGAGMANLAQSNPVLARTSFTANRANQAGALYNDHSNPTISHSVMQDNEANEGGAMVNIISQAFYSHLLITGNTAIYAAVLLNRQSEPRLSNLTVTGNAATSDSGIVNINSRTVIQNSILWDNHAVTAKVPEAPISDDANSHTAISNSIVQSATLGKGTNKNRNPLFIKPVDFTAASLSSGDFHLQATSPAIDMGNNDTIPLDLADVDLPAGDGITQQKVTVDLDYQPRISDGNGDGKEIVDVGVYEYSAAPATKYNLTINKLGSGSGTVTSSIAGVKCGAKCVGNYLAKTRVTLQVQPDPKSIFAGWTGDCQGNAAVIVEMLDNQQCTAYFELESLAENPSKDVFAKCEKSGGVAQGCDAQGNTLTDLTIYGDGNVQNAVISGRVQNQGWMTNVTVKSQASVTGGKLTGSVLNKGELQDVEFYGKLLSGGILSGTISNKSPNGVIRDVHLAAGATLRGGRLAGQIVGEVDAPARITDVIIAAGSSLQNILLEGSIVIEQDVTLETPVILEVQLAPNTQIIGGKITGKLLGDSTAPARLSKTQVKAGTKLQNVRLDAYNTLLAQDETCQREVLTDAQLNVPEMTTLHTANAATTVLSDLQDNTIAFNAQGALLSKIASQFAARIITENGEQANKTVLSRTEAKSLQLEMTIRLDAKHVNRSGEVLVAAVHTDDAGQQFRYMKTAQGWIVWDGHVENLQPIQSFKKLPAQVDLSIFAGDLSYGAGQFEVYTGYRLSDGTVVYNGKQAMNFSVLPGLESCNWTCSCVQ